MLERPDRPIVDDTRFVVARKAHVCTVCNNTISKGERYLVVSELHSEGWDRYKAHEGCSGSILADIEDPSDYDVMGEEESDMMEGWADEQSEDDFDSRFDLTMELDEFIY